MRRVDFFNLACHMQTSNTNELELTSLNLAVASQKEIVNKLIWKMECRPFQAVVSRHLAHPVQKHQSHLRSQLWLQLEQGLVVGRLIELGFSLHVSHFFLNHSLEVLNAYRSGWVIGFLDVGVDFLREIYTLDVIIYHLLILVGVIIIISVEINFLLLNMKTIIFLIVRIIEFNISLYFKWLFLILRWLH